MWRRLGWLAIANTAIVVGVFLLYALHPAPWWEVVVAALAIGANVAISPLNAYYRGAVDEQKRIDELWRTGA